MLTWVGSGGRKLIEVRTREKDSLLTSVSVTISS